MFYLITPKMRQRWSWWCGWVARVTCSCSTVGVDIEKGWLELGRKTFSTVEYIIIKLGHLHLHSTRINKESVYYHLIPIYSSSAQVTICFHLELISTVWLCSSHLLLQFLFFFSREKSFSSARTTSLQWNYFYYYYCYSHHQLTTRTDGVTSSFTPYFQFWTVMSCPSTAFHFPSHCKVCREILPLLFILKPVMYYSN